MNVYFLFYVVSCEGQRLQVTAWLREDDVVLFQSPNLRECFNFIEVSENHASQHELSIMSDTEA